MGVFVVANRRIIEEETPQAVVATRGVSVERQLVQPFEQGVLEVIDVFHSLIVRRKPAKRFCPTVGQKCPVVRQKRRYGRM